MMLRTVTAIEFLSVAAFGSEREAELVVCDAGFATRLR